jgi:hypothetical protein
MRLHAAVDEGTHLRLVDVIGHPARHIRGENQRAIAFRQSRTGSSVASAITGWAIVAEREPPAHRPTAGDQRLAPPHRQHVRTCRKRVSQYVRLPPQMRRAIQARPPPNTTD